MRASDSKQLSICFPEISCNDCRKASFRTLLWGGGVEWGVASLPLSLLEYFTSQVLRRRLVYALLPLPIKSSPSYVENKLRIRAGRNFFSFIVGGDLLKYEMWGGTLLSFVV
ncbi:hypothetical protein AVEN_64152-1 [Araneus ventricosus]|uniref:Uncharacterized protein n=1 Tax=Araneus ventricosus TaxID=182803 RepID=A0A4Y2C698_ARAVE|nr:hypothetical protein AVEN_64152-1 [Araneus ventricosus]